MHLLNKVDAKNSLTKPELFVFAEDYIVHIWRDLGLQIVVWIG